MRPFLAVFTTFLLLSGCSQVTSDLKGWVGDDLTRTTELATKYGKPEVAQCATFLNSALNAQDSTQAKIDALLAEPVAGILSATLKASLVAEMVRSLNDPAAQAQLQKDFDTNCRAVAGQIFLNLARDARKLAVKGATRGIGG